MNRTMLRRLLIALVLVLVFEGASRKLAPPGVSRFLILLKDLLIAPMVFLLFRIPPAGIVRRFMPAYGLLCAAFIPLIVSTALKDPLLAVFGAKQYLLYPTVALALVVGYDPYEVKRPFQVHRLMAYLLVPTAVIALLQLGLPVSHWLNTSVAGRDLSGFSAGGRLRVSSTFSFVAQYAWYLLAAVFALVVTAVEPGARERPVKLRTVGLLSCLLIGIFATGSRTAVVGSVAAALSAGVLIVVKDRGRGILWWCGFLLVALLCLQVTSAVFPSAFEAYMDRAGGLFGLSARPGAFADRLHNSFFGWVYHKGATHRFLGLGLGTMSNGVDLFSTYAGDIRANGIWGETDMANTFLEGGYYLLAVWIAFRTLVILWCLEMFAGLRTSRAVFSCAFALGSVVVVGLKGTLGVQPPWAIWFWLGVGTVFLIARHDAWVIAGRSTKVRR